MKETGIIMSGDHPRKCLDGTKTNTRRTAGLKEINKNPDDWSLSGKDLFHHWLNQTAFIFHHKITGEEKIIKCPYQVGSRLRVRETWMPYNCMGGIVYKADGDMHGNWKPSIHMFKKDARIWLEITEVRVERLNQISEADAIAEGIESRAEEWYFQEANGNRRLLDFTTPEYKRYDGKGDGWTRCPQLSYCTLWDSLNAKRGYSWESNPWCWCISFKLIK